MKLTNIKQLRDMSLEEMYEHGIDTSLVLGTFICCTMYSFVSTLNGMIDYEDFSYFILSKKDFVERTKKHTSPESLEEFLEENKDVKDDEKLLIINNEYCQQRVCTRISGLELSKIALLIHDIINDMAQKIFLEKVGENGHHKIKDIMRDVVRKVDESIQEKKEESNERLH